MDISKIENHLISEINLSSLQAKVFLYITIKGRKTAKQISKEFNISESEASNIANSLIDRGSLINFSKTEFEAMHPRFTAVNMYRRMCEHKKIQFKQNKTVDDIGMILEKLYDVARTK